MNIVDLIIKKRNGGKLTQQEIDFFVKATVEGTIADYQVSAMLMAIFLNKMDKEETAQLTMAMAYSGDTFDLSSIAGMKVDKHSTGGVADTTTLILSPLVASFDIPVVKMSGRGLGFSGGTLDKLEAIPGFRVCITQEEALQFADHSKIVLMSQSDNLTPADKKLYAMRDVTGTVDNISLIASSIMSKKIASGADAIVLDVKCGSGAFMKDISSARALANEMVTIGTQTGRKVKAIISSMEQPLGNMIGNSLEVIEAIEILKGNSGSDLLTVSLTLGAHMLILAGKTNSLEEAKSLLKENIQNGKGLEKLRQLMIQQGGNDAVIDDYSIFPIAKEQMSILSNKSGYVYSMDTAMIGRASLETGAGRVRKTDAIDFGAGIIMQVRIGDKVEKGQPIAQIYSSSMDRCKGAGDFLLSAIQISEQKPKEPLLILDQIG